MPFFETVYHNEGILIVNKDSGYPSQPTQMGANNLFDQLKSDFGYVGMHHRLDQPASGLILFTTDSKHNKAISKGFKQHTIRRRYTLVVAGSVSPSNGSWNFEINNKHATTRWQKKSYARRMSLLEAEIKTGRKHQIRIHAQQNGTPIVGDKRYGGIAGQLCQRLALHAHQLSFFHPACVFFTSSRGFLK